MLLPAEASHGVLVARQEGGGRNITTVTVVGTHKLLVREEHD